MVPTPFQGVFNYEPNQVASFDHHQWVRIQDETTLIDDVLTFTAGSKFEHNDFHVVSSFSHRSRLLWDSGRHGIPSWAVRFASSSHTIAIRRRRPVHVCSQSPAAAPSIVSPYSFWGHVPLEAEDLMAYEAGYREQVTDEFAWDHRRLLSTSTDDHHHDVSRSAPSFMLPEGPVLAPQIFHQSVALTSVITVSTSALPGNVTPDSQPASVPTCFLRIRWRRIPQIHINRVLSSSRHGDVTDNVGFRRHPAIRRQSLPAPMSNQYVGHGPATGN